MFTATRDNEKIAGLSVEFLINFAVPVSCVVYTLALCIKDAFRDGTMWKTYFSIIIDVVAFTSFYLKNAQLLNDSASCNFQRE